MSNPIYCRMQYVRIYHCTNVLWGMRTTLARFGWLMIMSLWSDDICHVVDLENMIHHHHQPLRINNKTTTILLAIYHHSKQIFILCNPIFCCVAKVRDDYKKFFIWINKKNKSTKVFYPTIITMFWFDRKTRERKHFFFKLNFIFCVCSISLIIFVDFCTLWLRYGYIYVCGFFNFLISYSLGIH